MCRGSLRDSLSSSRRKMWGCFSKMPCRTGRWGDEVQNSTRREGTSGFWSQFCHHQLYHWTIMSLGLFICKMWVGNAPKIPPGSQIPLLNFLAFWWSQGQMNTNVNLCRESTGIIWEDSFWKQILGTKTWNGVQFYIHILKSICVIQSTTSLVANIITSSFSPARLFWENRLVPTLKHILNQFTNYKVIKKKDNFLFLKSMNNLQNLLSNSAWYLSPNTYTDITEIPTKQLNTISQWSLLRT